MSSKNGKVNLRLAKVVLAELVKAGAVRRTMLEKQTVRRCGTRATFDRILLFLKREGFIVKAGAKRTAPYVITDKGKRFLEVFTGDRDEQT